MGHPQEFGKRVDWGMIARKAIRNLGKVSSQVLQRALIDTAVERIGHIVK